jgi:H+/Cl- antiporter ClcA
MLGSPTALLRSRSYIMLLVLAAILGAPISAVAYGYLALVSYLQHKVFIDLPRGLGLSAEPLWWPLPVLFVGGVLVALAVRYLPGRGGPSPAGGFSMHRPRTPAELPGVVAATLATLIFGAVLGPEMPLILVGGGLAALAVGLVRRTTPAQARQVVASAGSFASISTLLGSPLTGAFLLMEASGLGGATMDLVLLPGLLAAGIGSLIFLGLDAWTGLGTFSLGISSAPHLARPDVAEFGWAIVIGLVAALIGSTIRRLAPLLHRYADKRVLIWTPAAGLVVGGLAIGYALATGKPSSDVLFSGQVSLPQLVQHAAGYTAGSLLLLVLFKAVGYLVSMAAFRGGPVFPALLIGGAGGIALSHLSGLPLTAGVAMGTGAMVTVMLNLPLTSVLLPIVLLPTSGLAITPIVIVAVIVAYVTTARIMPAPAAFADAEPPPSAPPDGAPSPPAQSAGAAVDR